MSEARELLPYLQKADFSQNKIAKLPRVQCLSLKSLVIDENEIATVELDGHSNLVLLSMNKNKLTNGLCLADMPQLETLNINENEIATLEGMHNLP